MDLLPEDGGYLDIGKPAVTGAVSMLFVLVLLTYHTIVNSVVELPEGLVVSKVTTVVP